MCNFPTLTQQVSCSKTFGERKYKEKRKEKRGRKGLGDCKYWGDGSELVVFLVPWAETIKDDGKATWPET